jgi:hypothetical protein
MGMTVVRTLVERGTLGDGTSRVMAAAFLISCDGRDEERL